MIVFEKIRWKNLLSTGQQFTEIDLHDTPTTLIVGNNGAGKSTLLDALCFGLFAKPFRKISKTQLINTVNEKECIVEIEFNIGSVKYKVVRGMKPSRFDIYQNDKKYESNASVADDQKYLEQSILKLNFKSFTQVVILGSSTFVPFMQLTGPNRREVIEDILDIQIFSQMNVLLKERVKEIKEEQRSCEYEMDIAQQKVEMQVRNIENLEKVDTSLMEKKQKKFDQNEQRSYFREAKVKKTFREINPNFNTSRVQQKNDNFTHEKIAANIKHIMTPANPIAAPIILLLYCSLLLPCPILFSIIPEC